MSPLNFWLPYPFLRISLFFAIGILAGIYFQEWIPVQMAGVVFISGIGVYLFLTGFSKPELLIRIHNQLGMLSLILVMTGGYLTWYYHTETYRSSHLVHLEEEVALYEAIVTGIPEEREKTFRVPVRIKTAILDSNKILVQGKILVYFPKDAPIPVYGNQIVVKGNPKSIPPPQNPHEFDYARFLSFQQIHHQQFLTQGDWKITGHQPPSKILEVAFKFRARAAEILKSSLSDHHGQAVALALVLGVKDGIDNELRDAYAAAGAMHVLAVSGLHVGFIYGALFLALGRWRKTIYGRWILAIAGLGILWFYAMVTGLSPSVSRAVTMFSFIIVANVSNRTTNIYNTLAASAFALHCYDPYLIMSVGFQLSYAAVFAIVIIQPRLYALYTFRNFFLDKIWVITTVSIAAQAGTFILGLVYFNQFPVYFIFSNLVVIPGAMLILGLGILTIILGLFTGFDVYTGLILEYILRAVNYLVFLIENLPGSVIKDALITPFQAIVLGFGLTFSVLLLRHFRAYALYGALTALLLFLAHAAISDFHIFSKDCIYVYKVPGHSVMDIISNRRAYTWADETITQEPAKAGFHVDLNRRYHKVKHTLPVAASHELAFSKMGHGALMVFNEQNIYIMDGPVPTLEAPLVVDYILITKNAQRNPDLLEQINFNFMIIDSSNNYFAGRYWEDFCIKHGKNHHNVSTSGAYSIP